MGGAGPCIDFNLEEYEERCKHTGLSPLPEDVLGVVWARAHLWLMTSVRDVLQSDGWALDQGDLRGERCTTLKKHIDTQTIGYSSLSGTVEAIVSIPEAISAVFHPEFGRQLFGSFAIEAKRLNKETSTIHVHAVHSCIEDYFYLVQLLVPGLISLVCEEDYDDAGEGITARMLPSADWIGDHHDILIAILGKSHFSDILVAAADSKRAFKDRDDCFRQEWESDEFRQEWESDEFRQEWESDEFRHGWESDEDRMPDYTACDKECGYCGKCDY
ncbi:hypothetical protein GGX14DRAFT_392256 [Mycena pura]|uniref:Uncharacterized protein n=1 Tax=Mycena pura TaxID=153505 RepID=A0AAD6VJT3_9AGAR|nr:hypothetical protein GGX14DRAFT_392256 [Mycena pura]